MKKSKFMGGESSMTQRSEDETALKLELAGMKRNPYLADYQESRRGKGYNQREYRQRELKQSKSEGNEQTYARQAAKPTVRQVPKDRQRMTAKRRARIRRQKRLLTLAGAVCVLGLFVFSLIRAFDKPDVDGTMAPQDNQSNASAYHASQEKVQGISLADYVQHPAWTEDFLTPNEYSRPGDRLKEVKNIFVHYTANQGTSAAQNRSYFEQLKDTHERSASAHFIIGYEGEIIQCVPLDEIAYAVQTRNEDSVSIECCYLADDGSFTQETYDSLVALLQWLVATYDLETDDILRHYDCGGKKCPIYYTEHEDAWEELKEDVETF